MFSYVAFAWDAKHPTLPQTARELGQRILTSLPHMKRVLDTEGILVLCSTVGVGSNEAVPLHGAAGVVLGAVFERHADELDASPARRARFDEQQTRQIVASRGEHLIKACWGRYVAVMRDASANVQWVLRDPTGTLPCYRSAHAGLSIFFSHLPDLEPLQLPKWRISSPALRVRVVASMLHAGSQLENVEQIFGGECVELRGGEVKRMFYWSPLAVADRDPIEDPDYAARALRATLKSAVHTWAAVHPNLILRASGGLDSSIIAGCLRDAPGKPRISTYTVYSRQLPLNVLPWSRMIAAHLNVEPFEIERNPLVDWSPLVGLPPTATPVCDPACVESSIPELAFARERGATAILTGDGGDSLSGASTAKLAAREFFRRHGLKPRLLKVAEDVALLRDVTVWNVLGDVLRTRRAEPNEFERGVRSRVLIDPGVYEEFLARLDGYRPHPWYDDPSCPWSIIMRLGTLSQLPPMYAVLNGFERGSPEYVLPYYSQPVVELSLRIPAYLCVLDGRDRAIARQAFVDDVPEKILTRQWKDHPVGQFETMVQRNLPRARELLLDGVLVREKFLDRRRVEEHLKAGAVKSGMFVGELFDHFACEAWARRWATAA